MHDLSDLVTGQNLIFAAGVFVLVSILRTTFKGFFEGKLGQRLLPVLPVVFGLAGAFLGLGEGAKRWQDKIVLGLIVGFVSAHIFKLGKTSVLGYGVDDPIDKAALPAPTLADPKPGDSVGNLPDSLPDKSDGKPDPVDEKKPDEEKK